MVKTKARKRKALTAAVAIMIAAVILLSGTLAWQSYNQEALNEVFSAVNPGGRLHDDFVDITYDANNVARFDTMTYSKDVYVENFTSLASNGVQIFARVRLDEYMELGSNAGALDSNGNKAASNEAESIVSGAKLDDTTTWTTHIPGVEDPFHAYWNWEIGGQTRYMPTFNKNNNSDDADINGTFRENFEDYIDYAGNTPSTADDGEDSKTGDATYYYMTSNGGSTDTVTETHKVKDTINGYVITMQEWIGQGQPTGDFWVWDTDGWAYWANPINPDTATGLLLDQISRTEAIINEDWYYGINVVAQFVTGDHVGYGDNTGFYEAEKGAPPSDNAVQLLRKIGVDIPVEVDNAQALRDELTTGGSIVLTGNIVVNAPLSVTEDTVLDLNGYTISNAVDIYSEENKIWSLITVRGADTTLTINGGNFTAKENDCYAVDVRDGAKLIINGGVFKGNIAAVYVYEGTAVINGGEFSIQQRTDAGGFDQMINAYDANFTGGKAEIAICGGTFHGFNPKAANDGDLVADGYKVTDNGGVYTVSK